MAREQAIRGLVIVSIYFVVLFVVFTTVQNIANTYNLDADGFEQLGGGSELDFIGGYCRAPRFMQTFEGASIPRPTILYSVDRDLRYSTMYEQGLIPDNETCASLVGCEWMTVFDSDLFNSPVSFLSWQYYVNFWNLLTGQTEPIDFINDTYVARGEIDVLYYNDFIEPEDDFKIYELALLQQQQTLCEGFGYLWVGEQLFNSDAIETSGFLTGIGRTFSRMGDILRVLFQVTTLRFTFGNIPTLLNTLIVFMFIWSPLIYFFGCIYVLVR